METQKRKSLRKRGKKGKDSKEWTEGRSEKSLSNSINDDTSKVENKETDNRNEDNNYKIEISDKTVESAVEKGLEALGIKRDNAEIEVLNQPGSGLLGLWGNKPAKVCVSAKMSPEEYLINMVKTIAEEIDNNCNVKINVRDDDYYVYIQGKHMGILIGKKGQTLNSFQYLLNVMLRRQFIHFKGKVIVDIENYRERRKMNLEKLALETAERVVKMKREVELEPMSSYERREVHLALKGDTRVTSYSKGEEPQRKVVISPVK